jgi:hypothetical protein
MKAPRRVSPLLDRASEKAPRTVRAPCAHRARNARTMDAGPHDDDVTGRGTPAAAMFSALAHGDRPQSSGHHAAPSVPIKPQWPIPSHRRTSVHTMQAA